MRRHTATGPIPRHALTLVETVLSLVLIGALVSILLPALTSARIASQRETCANNQRQIGEAWHMYLEDHHKCFPVITTQPAWHYGGVRFSSIDETAYPDYDRPLTSYLPLQRTADYTTICCCCPADHGITDAQVPVGTGRRTAFRSYGTSYRANAALFTADAHSTGQQLRGRSRAEITASPSRLILCGDPVWYEAAEQTNRQANWHGQLNAGNILFLDGSVRFRVIQPRWNSNQPAVFDPFMPGTPPPETSLETTSSNEPEGSNDITSD